MKIRHRWQKIAIGIASCTIILLGLLTIGGLFFLKPLVADRVSKSVSTTSNGLYSMSFDDITYNPLTGNLVLSEVHLIPDTVVYKTLHTKQRAPDKLFEVYLPQAKFTGLSLISIMRRVINLGSVHIQQPRVALTRYEESQSQDTTKKKTPYQMISGFLKSLHIGRVSLVDAEFTHENRSRNKPSKGKIKNIDIAITNITIDSLADESSDKVFYADDYTFSIKEMILPDKKQFNDHHLNNILFSLRNRRLSLGQYHLKPRAGEMEFAALSKGRDRAEVQFKNIVINDINPGLLYPDNKLYAHSVSIDSGFVKVFKDKRYPKLHRDKTGEYPHQLLQKLSLKLHIDTIHINNTRVTYAEYDPEAKLTGQISFDRIKGEILNATNDSLPMAQNPLCKAQFHTYFMNRGNLDVFFTFNAASVKGDFSCRGQLGSLDGTLLNKMTVALTKVSVQSLQVNKYVFRFKGDNHRLVGSGTLYYQNLTATVLKVEKVTEKPRFRLFKKRHIHTFVANNLILKDSNPNKKGILTTGDIDYARPVDKSFFGAIWGGLSQSLVKCATRTVKE